VAITYTVDTVDSVANTTTIVSNTLTITAASLILVLFVDANQANFGTPTISNSGTALSWTTITPSLIDSTCGVAGWWAFGDANGNRTVTVTHTAIAGATPRRLHSIVHTGAHATTPAPSGKWLHSASATTDVSQTMTPTDANGSCLWMLCGDWVQTNTFAPLTNCSREVADSNVAGQYTTCLLRPTTQPRIDGNAFTLGETDTAGTITYIALEIVAAASGDTLLGQSPRLRFM